jgi:uncharacterized protein (TIGR02145 family)
MAMYTLSEAIKAAPEGWHVPSREEWKELIEFAGGWQIAGKRLKAAGGWGNGTDEFGFSAKPEDYGNVSGFSYDPGSNGIFHSSSPKIDDDGNEIEGRMTIYGVYFASDGIYGYDFGGEPSISVRLVKDDGELPPGGVFTDERDGKAYKCVKIGNQVWMAENLDYTKET